MQVGDTVRFLDEVGGGRVTAIDSVRHMVLVETEDGFEIPMLEKQCVVVGQPQGKPTNQTKSSDLDMLRKGPSQGTMAAKQTNEKIPARLVASGKKEAKKEDVLEVDLHIHKLLNNSDNMSSGAILDYQMVIFRQTMRQNLNQKGKKIVFIHGRGKGVLKNEITRALDREFAQCEYHDASFQQYAFGAIMVIIR